MTRIAFLLLGLLATVAVRADADDVHILSLQDRARVIDEIVAHRVETVLPDLMRRTGIDLWVVISREYKNNMPSPSCSISSVTA